MKFYIVDCFAEEKYQGNQLAVFIPTFDIKAREMQQIAKEIGFSETAFILSDKQEDEGYDVRIFTPDVEVPFAGHPALGTAYIIYKVTESGDSKQILLNLKVGQIPVTIDEQGLTMLQNEPEFGDIVAKEIIADVLSIEPDDIREDYPVQWVSTGLAAIIVPLVNSDAIKRCQINHDKFHKFHKSHYKCSILSFIQEDDGVRVRVFMDDTGFLEDPATGSANGNLAGYLLKHNFFGSDRIQYTVSQGSEMGRPAKLYIRAEIKNGEYHIWVGGSVHMVAEGNWIAS